MVRAVVVYLALLSAACFEDRYRCATDRDCNLGEAGRCELDGLCTVHDRSCDTERRYSEHSAEHANECFDDRIAIANVCAAGQPPALAEGCAQDVCAALPTCCESGWSEACVQQAQLRCAISCDTRIAVTANRGMTLELWELVWNGTAWTASQRTDRDTMIAWAAPAPGELEPRLAGFAEASTVLIVGELRSPAQPDHTYQAITSVDLDRDGRDTLAIGFVTDTQRVEIRKLDTGDSREVVTSAAFGLAWGDSDRDAFPDGVAGANTRYTLLDNSDGDDHIRSLSSTTSSNVGGGPTTGSPSLRKLDWIDLNDDHLLDLAVFGSQVRVHADADRLRDLPLVALDCDPPQIGCPTDLSINSFAGTALPALAEPALIVTSFPVRHIYRVAVSGPPAAISRTDVADDCPTCPPIIAATARDLDGDRQLDFIGLDENLRLYTALTTKGFRVIDQLIAPRPTRFTNVGISVSGAPIL